MTWKSMWTWCKRGNKKRNRREMKTLMNMRTWTLREQPHGGLPAEGLSGSAGVERGLGLGEVFKAEARCGLLVVKRVNIVLVDHLGVEMDPRHGVHDNSELAVDN
jgi:hypothetical protein